MFVSRARGGAWRRATGALGGSGREVNPPGDALSDAAASQIRSGLGTEFPQNFQFKADVSIKPAVAPVDGTVCQQLLTELLGKAKIRFESGSAEIYPDSAGLPDHLVETALRCPTPNSAVVRHPSIRGDNAPTPSPS